MELGIKFRPNKPRSLHLNGKVERSQQTDLHEFWATVDLADPKLDALLSEWKLLQLGSPSRALHGKSPIGRVLRIDTGNAALEKMSVLHTISHGSAFEIKSTPSIYALPRH